MKYKVGDKVKYDGGDWWFYGTVNAIFEHSICPCYRLNVERMEKKSCKFSITQFEFELEPFHEVVENEKDKRKWENSEIELLKKYYGVLNNEDLSKMLKRSPQEIEYTRQQMTPGQETLLTSVPEITNITLQLPLNTEVPEPEPGKKQRRKRKQEPKQEPEPENAETTQKPKKERPKRKRGEAWDFNLEMYQKGEKSNTISTWMSQNRREYKTGKLPERKLNKLLEISFPFETTRKKR